MNPKGKWMFRGLELQFINENIMAIYGRVVPLYDEELKRVKYYWEARTSLNTRGGANRESLNGFVFSEENAKDIVEKLLKDTETVEF